MSTSVGFFDHFDEAQKAVQALEDEGIDSGRISLIPEDGEPTKNNDVIPVTGSNVKSHRHIVSVETRSTEEDRIVKEFFRAEANPCICPPEAPVCMCGRVPRLRQVTRRALVPSAVEIERNPRARSAKLRAAERC